MQKFSYITFLFLITGFSTHTALAAAPAPPAPTPAEMKASYAAIAKLPDWSGAWVADTQPSVLKTTADIPLTSDFAAQLASLRKSVKAGGPMPPSNPLCMPYGMPLFMEQQGPTFDVLYAPGRVIMQSGYHEGRIIYTDGRKLTDDPDTDFFDGTSIGHWEGDTLVVETDGILPDAQVLPGITGSRNLRIAERIRLTSPDKLQDVITLTDPGTFTKPYTYTRTLTRHRDWDVTEYACLSGESVDYGVGLKMTAEEKKASTTANPPVREIAKPALNAASLPGGTWESIAQLPDWGAGAGVWTLDGGQLNEHHTKEVIPLIPAYAKRLEELRGITKVGGDIPTNNYHCWPRGPNMGMKAGEMGYFVFTPGQVTLITEGGEEWRIYTDGRNHPDNLTPSFYGHSIGHWEGDTLMIDMVGFRADAETMNGEVNGGNMHMVVRFHQTSPGKMTSNVTMTAAAFTAPWNYTRTYTLHRLTWMQEGFCTQNNRDVDPKTGGQTFDLTPPKY